jgi:AraC family transcriptional regulator of adaptative response / DNA-3-methyladenine glycosylase II
LTPEGGGAIIRAMKMDSDLEDGAATLELPFAEPYDWGALVGFLKARAIAGVEVVMPQAYARAIALGEVPGLLIVSPSPRAGRLSVTVRFSGRGDPPAIIDRVGRVFDLAADPEAIGRRLGRDPALAPLVAARPGLRVPGAWDGFELAVRAILGQQITVAQATVLAARIVRTWGEPLPPALAGRVPGLTHVFPSAERLAGADLSGLPMPRARSAAIAGLAAAVLADPAILEPGGDLAAAILRLKALPGVGDWTAHYIAMRQLRQPDAFPRGDIGLLRAMAGLDGVRPTAAALQARAEAWRPWRAYAALHLWTGGPLAMPAAAAAPTGREPDDRHAA